MKLIRSIRYILVILSALLGILGLGFSNATFDSTGFYYYANTNSYNTNGSYGYEVLNNGNLITSVGDAENKVFYWNFGNDNLQKTILAWYDNKLYFIGGQYGTLKSQGYLQNFCIVPKSARNDYLHDSCTYDTPISTIIEANPNFTDYAFTIYGSATPTWGYGDTPLQFCLSDENFDYCVSCSINTQTDNGPCQSGLSGTLNITASDYETITNFTRSNSPFGGGGSSDTPSTPSYQDAVAINSKIYDIFVQQGYSDNLCYGGYSLDNILTTSTGFDLSDIILGSGANIFELYNVYSGGYSFVNWYDTYYQYFNYARFSDNYGTFNGKSKGLLGLMATKQAVNSSFNSASIQNFCRLVIDGLYETPVQTPIGIINDSVADWQLSEVVGSVSYTPPVSGSNIDIIVQTLVNQGVIDGYTGVEDLSDFYTRYQDKLNQLTVKTGENGILPGYIALGFFAILMLYIFKK